MKPMRLLVALATLVVLGGAIWYSQKHPPKAESTVESTPKVKMLSVKDDQINEIHIVHPDTNAAVTLDKDGRGSWTIREPKEMAADATAAKGLASAIAGLESDQVVADKNTDWATYGLDKPKLVVQATLTDGKKVEVDLGNEAPTGSPVYARVSGSGAQANSEKLFGVATSVKTDLDKSVNDLRDKRLLRVDVDKVSKVTFTNQGADKGKPMEFARSGSDWQFIQPHTLRAENYAVEDLVRNGAAPYDSVVTEDSKDKEARKYDFAKPWATLEVVDPAGTHRLTIVKQEVKADKKKDANATDQTSYYAETSEMPGVFKLPTSAGSNFDKGIAAFRHAALFDLSFTDPDKVELRSDNTRVTLERKQDKEKKEDQWFNGPKKLDSEKVQSLLSLLRRISAKDYPSDEAAEQAKYGLDKPTVDVKVTIGGKVQHVMLASKDGKAYAAREGDPSTYEIDITDFSDLQKTIGELK